MKTIVINTSKESNNTKLDVLFKASFDESSLLWYDLELTELDRAPEHIKRALITETDTIDKDYNLIVLVDLYDFPDSGNKTVVKLYKGLMVKYIDRILIAKLHNEHDLLPLGAAVYFADGAKFEEGIDIDSLEDNYEVQQRKKNEELLAKALRAEKNARKRKDLVEEPALELEEKGKDRITEQKLIMKLFSWTEKMGKKDLKWMLKVSEKEDKYIDFSVVYSEIARSVSKSPDRATVIGALLETVADITVESKDRFIGSELVKAETVGGFYIQAHSCIFNRDNDESLIKGFFELLANVFLCVQAKKLLPEFKHYTKEEIKLLFIDALKRYKYFSNENNITMKFEPITGIFEHRETILANRKKAAFRQNEFRDATPEEVANKIMNGERSSENGDASEGACVRGLDRIFNGLVEEISENYDPDVIKKQNNRIIKSCLVGLWNWRDQQTSEDFKRTVDSVLEKQPQEKEVELTRERIAFIEDEYEKKYSDLVKEVTDAEYKLAGNKNILDQTRNLAIRYSDLMRKGKKYLVSFIGAIIAIVIAVLPYIYVEYYSGGDNIIFTVLYLIFTAGFAFLYATAAGIYMAVIRSKKLKLIDELSQLKKESESERKASIAALYKYYSSTVIETETHCLLWREILIRDKENSRKCVKRNNHIKRLEALAKEVERFATMIKLDIDGDGHKLSNEDIDFYDNEGLQLLGEASFYHPVNQRVYSLLPEPDIKIENKEEA